MRYPHNKMIELNTLGSNKLTSKPNFRKYRLNVIRKQQNDTVHYKTSRKSNYIKSCLIVQETLEEYTQASTVHGIRYLTEKERPLYEKLFWAALLILSAISATMLIWNTYVKWRDNPILVGFSERLIRVYEIPFPTVTVCPEMRTERSYFDFANISARLGDEINKYGDLKEHADVSEDDMKKFLVNLQVCEQEVIDRFAPYLPKNINVNVPETLANLTIEKNISAMACRWSSTYYLCERLYTTVATNEGICLQFNALKPKDIYRDTSYLSYNDDFVPDYSESFLSGKVDLGNITGTWSLDEGYKGQGLHAYPLRTSYASATYGFATAFQGLRRNLDYACRSFRQGYKVFLTSPESIPLTRDNFILVPHKSYVLVAMTPNYVISTDELRDVKPELRQCYFNRERYLRFFRHYTYNNCQTECLSNFTVSKCGCVKFWMPKPIDVPVCGLNELDCCMVAETELNALLQNRSIQQSLNPNTKLLCDCKPACNSLEYDYVISRSPYLAEAALKAGRANDFEMSQLFSRVIIFFKERQFSAIKRSVVYNLTNLICNFGSALSLFMAVTLLSLIELIYFATVQLMRNYRGARRESVPVRLVYVLPYGPYLP